MRKANAILAALALLLAGCDSLVNLPEATGEEAPVASQAFVANAIEYPEATQFILSVPRTTQIDSVFAGSNTRYLGRVGVHQSGHFALEIASDATETPIIAGDDLSSDFEQNGRVIVTRGSLSLTVEMGSWDTTEPYAGTPPNSAEVTAFATAVLALSSPAASSFTVTLGIGLAPTAPTIAGMSGEVGTYVVVYMPLGSGGDPPLSYSISGLPTGLGLSEPFFGEQYFVSGVPTIRGAYTVTYTVTDNNGDSDSTTFAWVIEGGDVTASTISIQTGKVGTPVLMTLPMGFGGDPPRTNSMSGLPPGLVLSDPATLTISGTPTTAGTYTVTYTVTDNNGDSDSTTFAWVITADQAPTAPAKTTRDRSRVEGDLFDVEELIGSGLRHRPLLPESEQAWYQI